MLKRSRRDVDLQSLVPPQFTASRSWVPREARPVAIEDATRAALGAALGARLRDPALGEPSASTSNTTCSLGQTAPRTLRRRQSGEWDQALLSAYIVEAAPTCGSSAGLGMGLEIFAPEPRWRGSWKSHSEHMKFLYGSEKDQRRCRASAPKRQRVMGSGCSFPPRMRSAGPNSALVSDASLVTVEQNAISAENELLRRDLDYDGEDEEDGESEDDGESSEALTGSPLASGERPPLVQLAEEFAKKTALRRGFFASALKRRLEALHAENKALKAVVCEVFTEPERAHLFAQLGSENAPIVAEPDGTTSPEAAVRTAFPEAAAAASPAASAVTGVGGAFQDACASLFRRDLCLVRVVQQAQRAFVVTNPALPDNPIVWVSEAFLTLTLYSRDEVIGRNCRFLQGAKTDRKAVDQIRKAVMAEHEESIVLLNYRRDGSAFWNRFFIAPLRASGRQTTFFVGVQTDALHTPASSLPTAVAFSRY